jgi:uncharacterized protein DUF4041/Meiotically Up-regulated Gene 113 (MUG113) protein
MTDLVFSTPPGWPEPPSDWTPPAGWTPDPSWPPAPPGWSFWTVAEQQLPSDRHHASDDKPTTKPERSAATPPLATAYQPALLNVVAAPTVQSDELTVVKAQLDQAQAELAAVRDRLTAAHDELVELDDAVVLQEVGIYEYHHPLENAAAYRDGLRDVQTKMKDAVKQGEAVLASTMFSYNNSLAAGRKMSGDFSKLMLRAYNAEADNGLRSLRAGNVVSATKRLEVAATTIAKLGSMMEMRIAPDYHALRIEELELTADYLMKVQEERGQAREERERLREERKAEEEIARERERLDKERAHYLITVQRLTEQGKQEETSALQERLAQIDAAIEQNEFRAANIRAGSVYVISNVGAFGGSVVKIGMTRRLDPLERVRELGDASVPFPYDVHAVFFSKDAVTLENELHKAFAARRVNHVNTRREFFFATPAEVREILSQKVGNLLEFTEKPEATQYHQSKSSWPTPGGS